MRSGWWVVAVSLLLAGLLLPLDQAASSWMLDQVGEVNDQPVLRQDSFNQTLGIIFGSSPFFYLLFILASYPKPAKRLGLYAFALVGSAALTQLLKVLIGRARPDTDLGSFAFTTEALHEVHGSMQSFPSGHATTAITLGVLLGRYLPRFRYVFWFGAANICLERMVSDRHFLSDVLGGAAVALLVIWLGLQVFGRRATDLRPDARPPRPTLPLLAWGIACLTVSLALLANSAGGGTWDLQVAGILSDPHVQRVYATAGPVIGLLVGLVLLYALLTTFANGHALLFGFFTAVTTSTIALHLFKTAIGRARPLVEVGAFTFEPFRFSQTMNAFPSGHTTFNVLVAILLSCYFPNGRVYFFFVAAAIMFERVVNQFHWPSDLCGGVALATATFLVCYRLLGRRRYIPERDATMAP